MTHTTLVFCGVTKQNLLLQGENGTNPPFWVVFKRELLFIFADVKNMETMEVKKSTREYLTPEVEVVEMSLVTSLLIGSENLLSKPGDYTGFGEGFDW